MGCAVEKGKLSLTLLQKSTPEAHTEYFLGCSSPFSRLQEESLPEDAVKSAFLKEICPTKDRDD
jgi:hypothetical protein